MTMNDYYDEQSESLERAAQIEKYLKALETNPRAKPPTGFGDEIKALWRWRKAPLEEYQFDKRDLPSADVREQALAKYKARIAAGAMPQPVKQQVQHTHDSATVPDIIFDPKPKRQTKSSIFPAILGAVATIAMVVGFVGVFLLAVQRGQGEEALNFGGQVTQEVASASGATPTPATGVGQVPQPQVHILSPLDGAIVPTEVDIVFHVTGISGYRPSVNIIDPLGYVHPWHHAEHLGDGNYILKRALLATNLPLR